jgi:hypothetical protein
MLRALEASRSCRDVRADLVRYARGWSLIRLADEAGHGLQALRRHVYPLSRNETCLLNRAPELL